MKSAGVLFSLAFVVGLSLVTWQPAAAPAAAVVPFSFAATDTLMVPEGFGGISLEAVGGNVGLRLLGGTFAAAGDSIPLASGEWFATDVYSRFRIGRGLISGIAVYVSAGASVRGVYW